MNAARFRSTGAVLVALVALMAFQATAPGAAVDPGAALVTLSGLVTDPSGIPVLGVIVTAVAPIVGPVASATTDLTGHYALQVAPGVYLVIMAPPPAGGLSGFSAPGLPILTDTVLNAVLQPATPLVTFRGVLRDRNGVPVPGQTINLSPPPVQPPLPPPPPAHTTTLSDGSFSLSVPPGTYAVGASSPNTGPPVLPPPSPAGAPLIPDSYGVSGQTINLGGDRVQDLLLPAAILTVTVIDPAGAPVPGATVSASAETTSVALFPGGSGSATAADAQRATDASGSASLVLFPTGGPPSGAGVSLLVLPPPNGPGCSVGGFCLVTEDGILLPGDTSIVVRLSPTVRFSGSLRNDRGAPLAGQLVQFAPQFLGGRLVVTTTAADGSFSKALDPGRYQLNVLSGTIPAADTTGALTPVSYEVHGPVLDIGADRVQDLTLPSVVSLTVTVIDLAGVPVPSATVKVPTYRTRFDLFPGGSAEAEVPFPGGGGTVFITRSTDLSGMASMTLFPTAPPPLAPGSFGVTVVADPPPTTPRGSPLISQSLTGLTLPADTTITLQFKPPITFAGTLGDRGGRLLPGRAVRLKNPGLSFGAITGADGSFSVVASPGTYELDLGCLFDGTTLVGCPASDPAGPQFFTSAGPILDLGADRFQDITLPAAVVDVSVVDGLGRPIPGAAVSLPPYLASVALLPEGPTEAAAVTANPFLGTPPLTDGGGIARLILLPGAIGYFGNPLTGLFDLAPILTAGASPDPTRLFGFVAGSRLPLEVTPPPGTDFLPSAPVDVEIAGDMTVTVLLQRPDATPPLISAVFSPPPNAAGWNDSDVTVTWSVSDPESGIASSRGCDPVTITQDTAGTDRTCMAVNGSGLASSSTLTVRRDATPPSITIVSPQPAGYLLNQALVAHYVCADGGSGLTSCTGTSPDGMPLATSSVGTDAFTVSATDLAGNRSTASATYTVAYSVCALFDQSKAVTAGSTVPVKLALCDASGADVSSAAVVVTATSLTQLSSNAPGTLQASGDANPDNNFRFDATLGTNGGYIFNLSTKGLTTGTYRLSFTATNDPLTHTVQFQVK